MWDPATNTLHAESDEPRPAHTLLSWSGDRRCVRWRRTGIRSKATRSSDSSRRRQRGHRPGGSFGDYRRDLDEALERVKIHGHEGRCRQAVQHVSCDGRSLGRSADRDQAFAARARPRCSARSRIRSITAIGGSARSGTAPVFITPFLATPALTRSPAPSARSPSAASRSPRTGRRPTSSSHRSGRGPACRRSRASTRSTSICSDPGRIGALGGWPVAIFGHGFTDSKHAARRSPSPRRSRAGIATRSPSTPSATVAAPFGLADVSSRASGAPVTIPTAAAASTRHGNGTIDSTEGRERHAPRGIIGNRDGLRQTVADLMYSSFGSSSRRHPGAEPHEDLRRAVIRRHLRRQASAARGPSARRAFSTFRAGHHRDRALRVRRFAALVSIARDPGSVALNAGALALAGLGLQRERAAAESSRP